MMPMESPPPLIAPFVEAIAAVLAIVAGLTFFFTTKKMLPLLLWALLVLMGAGLWLHAVWALPK